MYDAIFFLLVTVIHSMNQSSFCNWELFSLGVLCTLTIKVNGIIQSRSPKISNSVTGRAVKNVSLRSSELK